MTKLSALILIVFAGCVDASVPDGTGLEHDAPAAATPAAATTSAPAGCRPVTLAAAPGAATRTVTVLPTLAVPGPFGPSGAFRDEAGVVGIGYASTGAGTALALIDHGSGERIVGVTVAVCGDGRVDGGITLAVADTQSNLLNGDGAIYGHVSLFNVGAWSAQPLTANFAPVFTQPLTGTDAVGLFINTGDYFDLSSPAQPTTGAGLVIGSVTVSYASAQ